MSSTPRLALPYAELTDGPDGANVPYWLEQLALALDIAAIYDQGTVANRPISTPGSPGIRGRFYYATDESILYLDLGTSWVAVQPGLTVDGPPGTGTLRTLGTGAQQAASGADARLSDQRVPVDGTVTSAKVAASLKPSGGAGAGTEALRALGTAAGLAAAGTHGSQHAFAGADPIPGIRYLISHTELGADLTMASTNPAAPTPVLAAPDITTDANDIIDVEWYFATIDHNDINQSSAIELYVEGVRSGRIGQASFGDGNPPQKGERRLTPGVGTWTFEIRGWRISGGGTIKAGDGIGSNYTPSWIRIWRTIVA